VVDQAAVAVAVVAAKEPKAHQWMRGKAQSEAVGHRDLRRLQVDQHLLPADLLRLKSLA